MRASVREHFDKKVTIMVNSRDIDFQKVTQADLQAKIRAEKTARLAVNKGARIRYIPPTDHPWRRPITFGRRL